MRLLRRAIRKLILEADLGQQVWSKRAPRKSRHRGTEEDTEIESRMFKALFDWLEDEDASGFKDPVVAQAYIDASQNPKYNDVITTDTTVGEFPDVVYRGLAVSRSVLRDYVGLTDEEIKQACLKLTPVTGRMELFGLSGHAHAVVDYAHTPDALENALKACRQHCDGQLWVVFGCGGDRDKGKRPQMGEIACDLADKVIITNDNPRSESPQQIADEIALGCTQKHKVSVMLSRQEAVINTLSKAKKEDMVLLAGKGHEDYIVLGNNKHFYSERETVQSYFASKVAK